METGGVLKFGDVSREPHIRRARDMKEAILDKGWLKDHEDEELYFMYRDLWLEEDRDRILRNNLRYDITVMPPRSLGKEFVKTLGHYHPECVPGVRYPEIYEVLDGKVHVLLQKRSTGGDIEDVVLVEAEEGEKILLPPNYGHVIINPGKKTLRMANWICRSFNSEYEEYRRLSGAAYYELVSGEFVKNPNYGELPEIRRIEPTVIRELGIEEGKEMYWLIREPEKLRFLTEPQSFGWVFDKVVGEKWRL
ncbi:MAG: glucose-6-phosphate isomerase [Hadesarchaea archaeon]|nr:glucose-6-phosphate isomerase [Hadesarchaea archaeon]